MKKELLLEIIMALLILLFLYASFSKYADFEYFKRSMHNQPFTNWFTVLLIWTLPFVEILVSLALAISRTRIYGLYAFLILMSLFSAYIAAILLHLFPRVPCSCGGVIQALGWGKHLLFNLFFIAIAWIALVLHRKISKSAVVQLTRLKNAH